MSIESIRIEVLGDILHEHEVNATPEQIKAIAKDFALHLEMESEYSYTPSMPSKCEKCESKDRQIKDLEKEVRVYNKSVMTRRNCEHVWLEGDTVMYK